MNSTAMAALVSQLRQVARWAGSQPDNAGSGVGVHCTQIADDLEGTVDEARAALAQVESLINELDACGYTESAEQIRAAFAVVTSA